MNFHPCIPATEHLLILFVAHLAQSCCHSTIRAYLSAVRFLHISHGYGDPMKDKLGLEQILKGVRRVRRSTSDSRLPITPYILEKIHAVISHATAAPECVMMWAACCLEYFAFLRAGEFTLASTDQFDPETHLSPADVAIDSHSEPSLMRVHLKYSKTDQQRRGVDLYVGRTFNNICPVAAMLAYLPLRGQSQGPLFMLNGQSLSREVLVCWLRTTLTSAGVDASHFSGHSFRIGAASTGSSERCGGKEDSNAWTMGERFIQTLHSNPKGGTSGNFTHNG